MRLPALRSAGLFAAAACLLPLSTASAQGSYQKCGDIVQGVTCQKLFLDDDGDLWLLDTFGGYQIGDHVEVSGTADPGCISICNQGNGCIYGNTIGPCGDPTTAYCFCEPASACGNTDPAAGCDNSTGAGALLAGAGSLGVAADDLTLTVSNVPANQFGLLYMGPDQAQVPFGDGLRCVAPGATGFFRFPVQNAGPGGSYAQVGVVGATQALFPPAGQIQAGDTWNFQGWYRDPAGPCGQTFNLTNGASATFAP